jgi:hypothetical protein
MASTYVIGGLVGYALYSLSIASDAARRRVGERSDPTRDMDSVAIVTPSRYGRFRRSEVDQRIRGAKLMMGPENQIKYFSRHPVA